MASINTTPSVVYTNNATTAESLTIRSDGVSARWSAGPDAYTHSYRQAGTPNVVVLSPGETIKAWTYQGNGNVTVSKVVPL